MCDAFRPIARKGKYCMDDKKRYTLHAKSYANEQKMASCDQLAHNMLQKNLFW